VRNGRSILPAQAIFAVFEKAVLLLLPILTRAPMTGDQSRLLRPLDRVFWGGITTDQGTVIETAWAGVSINWDNGHTTSIQHNDMAKVERVPKKK
jgi:hypothetical protein